MVELTALLVHLIDKAKRKIVDPDFEDEMGDGTILALPGLSESKDFTQFRAKAQAFLKAQSSARRKSSS